MRALLAALIFCFLLAPAKGGYLIPEVAPDHVAHHATPRQISPARTVLSAACRLARALGGPCGCFASEYFFGHSVRELWAANAWLSFPHVAPAPGTAAVWTNRHVAPVIAANSDGTVMVRDSWAVHRVRIAGLVFVDPRGGLPPFRARRRYASA